MESVFEIRKRIEETDISKISINHCPFCGYKGTVSYIEKNDVYTGRVKCNKCHTKGPTASIDIRKELSKAADYACRSYGRSKYSMLHSRSFR